MKLHNMILMAMIVCLFGMISVSAAAAAGTEPCYYSTFKHVRHCINCHKTYQPTAQSYELGPLSKVPENIRHDPAFIKSDAASLFATDRSQWIIDDRNAERNPETPAVDLFGVVSGTAENSGTTGNSSFGGTINNPQNTSGTSGVDTNSNSNNGFDGYDVDANNGYDEIRYVLGRGDNIRQVVLDIVAYELKQRNIAEEMTEAELDDMESLVRRYNKLRWSFGDPVVGDILAIPVPAIDALAATKKSSENESNSSENNSNSDEQTTYDMSSSGMTSSAFDNIFGGSDTGVDTGSNDGVATDDPDQGAYDFSTPDNEPSADIDNSTSTNSNSSNVAGGLDVTLPLSATPQQLSAAGKKELDELDSILSNTLKGDLNDHIEVDSGSSMTSYYMGQDEMNRLNHAIMGFTNNGNRSAMRCSGATYDRIARIREAMSDLADPMAKDVHVLGYGAEPAETKREAKEAAKKAIAELRAALRDLKSAI